MVMHQSLQLGGTEASKQYCFLVKVFYNVLKFLVLIESRSIWFGFLLLKNTSNRNLRLVVDGVVVIAKNELISI
jgi:hypothetical protein